MEDETFLTAADKYQTYKNRAGGSRKVLHVHPLLGQAFIDYRVGIKMSMSRKVNLTPPC
jgi:hypothetical protein